jgi:cytochrome P450
VVRSEIADFLTKHASSPTGSESWADQLGEIPITAWESELPSLEKCILETVRLTGVDGALARRNMGEDLVVDKQTIRHGDFVLLLTGNVHLDPRLYPEPRSFIPDRDMSAAAEVPVGWLGFGSGGSSLLRHLKYIRA